jgi:SPP1 family predicted phage head-tail adaptor
MTLSTLELAQLRADQGNYLPDTCTIQTKTSASDGMGGWTDTWSNTYTSVSCRLAPMSPGDESLQAEQLAMGTGWVLTIAHNQVIAETNRVVHDSETYEVVGMEDTHSNRTAKRIYLRRLD